MSSLGMYGDGGSMSGSGIDDRDIQWTFICDYCESDNDNADATTDGSEVWSFCGVCLKPNIGRLED